MSALLAFAAVVLRGVVRDRSSLFFMLALPVLVIVVIGATFGGEARLSVGVVQQGDGPVTRAVVGSLSTADGLRVIRFGTVEDLRRAARRLGIRAGVVLPAHLDADLAAGRAAELTFIPSPDGAGAFAARSALEGGLTAVGVPATAARAVATVTGRPFGPLLVRARAAAAGGGASVTVVDVGRLSSAATSRFSGVAPQNLVLFVFLNGMTSGAWIVRSRRTGILRRALSTPVTSGRIIVGLGLGSLAFTLLQSALIIVVGTIGFGVGWGDPVAAAALAGAFAAVACGAGLLVGALFGTEERVGSITPPLGLVLGALGGCMIPLAVFPPVMRTVALAVPHSWALDGWQRLIFDGAGLTAIAGDLAVLLGFATGAVVLAARVLRRQLASGAA